MTTTVRQPVARARVVLVVMCTGLFLVQLDVSIVNVALPSIRADLHPLASGLQWVVDGYALALASLMLAGGTIGDLYGHRRVVLTGFAVFGAASLLAGLAPGAGALIAARVAQGIGAALLLPGTLAIISDTFDDPAQRARAIGIWAAVAGISLPSGPILGGLLVSGPGWRWVSFVNLPIVAVASALTVRVVRESREDTQRRLDVAGVVLGALALFAITLAFISAGRDGAGSPVVLAVGVVAVAAAAALIAVERRHPWPMLPLGLFARKRFMVANAVAGTMNLGTLGCVYLLTLYLQVVQHLSPMDAGLAMVPLFAPLPLLAPLSGRLAGRFGPRRPMAGGLTVAACGLALLATAGPHSAYEPLVAAFLLWSGGLGLLTSAVAAAVGAVERRRSGLASAVNNTARQAGGAIGIAAFGALAGEASAPGFVHGVHLAALMAAALYLLAVVPTVAWVGAGRA